MPSVSNFLIERLTNTGLRHVFGVPGDYILGTYKKLQDDPNIELVGTTDESAAGFAADGYARVHGVGCVCVTYNVGGNKIINPVAQAFAERSPVIVLVGSPGVKERSEKMLLHHLVRDYDTQRKIFSNITCANTVLSNPANAAYEIDRVFEALKHFRQPIYIEIPRDVADLPIRYDVNLGTPASPTSNPDSIVEAIQEVGNWFSSSKKPAILAGVELARFGLGEPLLKFAERLNIPIFTEVLSKSVVPETHPLFGGVYVGGSSEENVRSYVEESDCLLMLGVMLTDMTLGFSPNPFNGRDTVNATVQCLKVRNHVYQDVVFNEFCQSLFKYTTDKKAAPVLVKKLAAAPFVPDRSNTKLSTRRLFNKIDSVLTKDMIVITDIGESLFGSLDLKVQRANSFLSPAYYTSMGSAIPQSLGVTLARPDTRAIVVVGDGAFQMSFGEISTLVDRGLNPIIFVINNGGYMTERLLLDGKFNDIRNWNYHKVAEVFDGGRGFLVRTESELEQAVEESLQSHTVSVINVVLDSGDISPTLRRMTEGLAKLI